MYLHLNPETAIPLGDIVAILQYPNKNGRAVLQSFNLPLYSVDAACEGQCRSLVVTKESVYTSPLTAETVLRRYQKSRQVLRLSKGIHKVCI